MDAKVCSNHSMPERAAFVQRLLDAFGNATIEATIQRGKAGERRFFACKNGRPEDTASPSTLVWRVDDAIFDRHFCRARDESLVETDVRCIERR